MQEGNYQDIYQLALDGGLVPEEVYGIVDYTSFPVYVTAMDEENFYPAGYTYIGGDECELMYDIKNNQVYYLNHPIKNVSAYFDWTDKFIGTVDNISLPEMRNEYGGLVIPDITIKDSSDIHVDGDIYGSWSVTNCEHVIIGYLNEDLQLDTSSYVTIGDCNENITITSCEGVLIGDGNFLITVENSDGVEIGSDNEEMTVGEGNSIAGSRNKYVSFEKGTNVIGSLCQSITIDSRFNDIRDTKNATILGNFSKISESDSITIDANSVGNNLEKARIISMEKVNNNNISTSNMSLVETGCFNEYADVGKIRTYRDIAKQNVVNQADNYGTVLNIERNNLMVSERGAMDYEMTNGAWIAKTVPGKQTTNRSYTVRLNIAPELARLATFTGAGTYDYGDEIVISATGSGFEVTGYVDNVTGIRHEGSTWTTTATSNMVIVPLYTISVV